MKKGKYQTYSTFNIILFPYWPYFNGKINPDYQIKSGISGLLFHSMERSDIYLEVSWSLKQIITAKADDTSGPWTVMYFHLDESAILIVCNNMNASIFYIPISAFTKT